MYCTTLNLHSVLCKMTLFSKIRLFGKLLYNDTRHFSYVVVTEGIIRFTALPSIDHVHKQHN